MKNIILLFTAICLCLSCAGRYSQEVEEVLRMAGGNRSELEKVLKHYSRNHADSLKLRAAEFLIVNMPGKYSEYYDAPWNDVATVRLRWTSSPDKRRVLDTYKLEKPIIREDMKCITADYLISNIDLAFRAWRDKPWGKHVSFDTFREEILPYRVSTEPLENWREKVLASFADIDRAFREDSTMTAVEACSKVNTLLPRFRLDKDFPPMNYSQLMASTRGLCNAQTALAAFVMRALGIPVTMDFTPLWTAGSMGHHWNSVCDSTGRHISFMGAETNPYEPHIVSTDQIAKAYRETFGHHRIVSTDDEHTPPVFRHDFTDTSTEHDNHADVAIPAGYQPKIQTGYAYLTLLYDAEWHIVGYGSVDGDSIRYPSVGKNVIYLPVYYANGQQSPAGAPFYINNDGEIHSFEPAPPDTQLTFRAIAAYDDRPFSWRMTGGSFEGADNPDFTDAAVLHTIKNMPEVYNIIALKSPACYRYVRYKSPDGGYGNVAEIVFLDVNGQKLHGGHIGTVDSRNAGRGIGNGAFDGDVMTFYEAKDRNGAWTGLDMERQQCISAIQYMPRLEGYSIYAGHKYELFYWAGNGWKSRDIQTSSGMELTFRIPRNSLCYIHNHTIRKNGQPFIQKDNKYLFSNIKLNMPME
jgi:hypothetical protein